MPVQKEILFAPSPEIDEQAYWKEVEATQVLAQSRGWLVRYGIEYGDAPTPSYAYTIDPKEALALFKKRLFHKEDNLRECFAEYLDPESLDILGSKVLLDTQVKRVSFAHTYIVHIQALKQNVTHLEIVLRGSSGDYQVNWHQADHICALLHSLVDHVQRSIARHGDLAMMSAAQTSGPIPCVFVAKDESEDRDGTRNEKPIFIEVASDAIAHGLTVFVHADDPGPQSLPKEAIAKVFLEHYQSSVQLHLFESMYDEHWISPAESGSGHVPACIEQEHDCALVLISDTQRITPLRDN